MNLYREIEAHHDASVRSEAEFSKRKKVIASFDASSKLSTKPGQVHSAWRNRGSGRLRSPCER